MPWTLMIILLVKRPIVAAFWRGCLFGRRFTLEVFLLGIDLSLFFQAKCCLLLDWTLSSRLLFWRWPFRGWLVGFWDYGQVALWGYFRGYQDCFLGLNWHPLWFPSLHCLWFSWRLAAHSLRWHLLWLAHPFLLLHLLKLELNLNLLALAHCQVFLKNLRLYLPVFNLEASFCKDFFWEVEFFFCRCNLQFLWSFFLVQNEYL